MVGSEAELHEETVVVIDTLRATSTIVAALMAGAREVIPVAEIDEAVAVAQRLGKERTLLCGEKGAVKIDGFDLGNSPHEYLPELVEGKTLVLRTTNGTRALKAAASADAVLCAAFVNCSAVANYLVALQPQQVTILCSGTEGAFSFEDALAAGALADALASQDIDVEATDGFRAVQELYRQHCDDIESPLREGEHGRKLLALGLEEDIVFCARKDVPGAVVPVLNGSMLQVAHNVG